MQHVVRFSSVYHVIGSGLNCPFFLKKNKKNIVFSFRYFVDLVFHMLKRSFSWPAKCQLVCFQLVLCLGVVTFPNAPSQLPKRAFPVTIIHRSGARQSLCCLKLHYLKYFNGWFFSTAALYFEKYLYCMSPPLRKYIVHGLFKQSILMFDGLHLLIYHAD